MSDFVQVDTDIEEKSIQYNYEQEVYERNRKFYEDSRKNWETLNDGQADQERQFDKASLAIAAGSFGVSFAFIDKVIPLANAEHLSVLTASWALFGFCLLVILIGYRVSSMVLRSMCEEEKQNLQNLYGDKPVNYKERRVFLNLPEVCNNLALIANVGGIVCLILFVFLNF